MSAVPELLRVVGKRHELEVENERLRADAHNWHQHYRDERSLSQRWKEHSFKLEQEIERMRQKLARVVEIAGELSEELSVLKEEIK